jgi:DNA processing protein
MEKQIINWFDEEYPQKLLAIKKYPERLHCIGNCKILNNMATVAIVGSRNCTAYGRKYAEIFAKELSKSGITVISGLALGIDTEAHLGAVKGKGNTIAVLGGGLDNVTPEENIWLYNKILYEGGCIVTECEDEEIAVSQSYQKRNRIISGIADSVLIVEASNKSGSMITAKHAKEQNKEIYCIPNRIDESCSSGIQQLIREGAKIVTRPEQIIKKFNKKQVKNNSDNSSINLPNEYMEIYTSLVSEKTIEELSEILNMEISELNSKLAIMEIEGYVNRKSPNMYERN